MVGNENKPVKLPQVDKILRSNLIASLKNRIKRDYVAELVKRELAQRKAAPWSETEIAVDEIAQAVKDKAESLLRGCLQKVINGTGVILNTNLGRAPLPKKAVESLCEMLKGYSNLEIDLESGKRGKRTQSIESLIGLLTGAESAIVVNNNAAAVMLTVNSLAFGQDVVISRGELIEIGGSFRLPDVITQAGSILKEVGTTNRTRLSDYQRAVTQNTGILLKCHRSNFEVTGFTEEASLPELVSLSKQCGVPLIQDLGSGAFVELSQFGLKSEPTVAQVIKGGADLVLFSADKLLGASQAGIIVGKRSLTERLLANPVYRTIRLDKFAIALVEYVLTEYLSPNPEHSIPALIMATVKPDKLKERARKFSDLVNANFCSIRSQAAPTSSTLGGGSLPGQTLDSYGVKLTTKGTSRLSAEKLSALLRRADTPVIALVKDEHVWLDFRTIAEWEEGDLFLSLASAEQACALSKT